MGLVAGFVYHPAAVDGYVRELAEAVTGKLGGKVGVAPRIFLKKLVADILEPRPAAGDGHWHGLLADGLCGVYPGQHQESKSGDAPFWPRRRI